MHTCTSFFPKVHEKLFADCGLSVWKKKKNEKKKIIKMGEISFSAKIMFTHKVHSNMR